MGNNPTKYEIHLDKTKRNVFKVHSTFHVRAPFLLLGVKPEENGYKRRTVLKCGDA